MAIPRSLGTRFYVAPTADKSDLTADTRNPGTDSKICRPILWQIPDPTRRAFGRGQTINWSELFVNKRPLSLVEVPYLIQRTVIITRDVPGDAGLGFQRCDDIGFAMGP